MAYPAIRNAGIDVQFEDARRRGYAAGFAEALRDAEVEFQERVAKLEVEHLRNAERNEDRSRAAVAIVMRAADALDQRTAPVLADADHAVVKAAMELAEAILCRELRHGPTSARSALARALDHAAAASVVAVRMNPTDLALLEDDMHAHAGIAFVADPSLKPGDAIAQLEVGLLDARISTALDRARHELAEETE